MTRGAAVLGTTLLALLASCHDSVGVGHCFEPNAQSYGFALNGDTNLVFHWPSAFLVPVRVYAEPVGALPANTLAAMALWASAFRCGELILAAAADSTHADIIVRNPPFLPPVAASVVLHADSAGACTGVTKVDTVGKALAGPIRAFIAPFSADTTAVASCYHFVTAHELGHALGLFEHSSDTNDLMYATPRRRVLSEADKYTIQLLYHTPSKLAPAPRQ